LYYTTTSSDNSEISVFGPDFVSTSNPNNQPWEFKIAIVKDHTYDHTLVQVYDNIYLALIDQGSKKISFTWLDFYTQVSENVDDSLSLTGQNIPNPSEWCPTEFVQNPLRTRDLEVVSRCAINNVNMYRFDLSSIEVNMPTNKKIITWKVLNLKQKWSLNDTSHMTDVPIQVCALGDQYLTYTIKGDNSFAKSISSDNNNELIYDF